MTLVQVGARVSPALLREATLLMLARAVPAVRRLACGYQRRVSGNRANIGLLLLHRILSTRPGIKKSGGWKRNDRAWLKRARDHARCGLRDRRTGRLRRDARGRALRTPLQRFRRDYRRDAR